MRIVPGVIAVAVLAVAPAHADIGVPNPNQSSIEQTIVGSSSGALIGDGYRVVVRDFSANPLAGVDVALYCLGLPVRPYDSQMPQAVVTCQTRSIHMFTGPDGLVTFQPRIGGYVNVPDVKIYANGVLLGMAAARSTDIDGNGATDIADFAIFRVNFLTSPAQLPTDFDESNVTDVADFDIFRRVFLFDVPGTVCP